MIRLLVLTLMLSGCVLTPSQSDSGIGQLVTESPSLDAWLHISSQITALTPEQAKDALSKLTNPQQDMLSLFSYGALNQQLRQYDGWVQARDAFRRLSQHKTLGPNLKELARLRMDHNQDLINWYERHRHLQKELAESILDREQLKEKIAALAELEAAMSNRKQQIVAPANILPGNAASVADEGVQQ